MNPTPDISTATATAAIEIDVTLSATTTAAIVILTAATVMEIVIEEIENTGVIEIIGTETIVTEI